MAELIVYFSRPGNNYVNGSIKHLPKGNTEVVAEFIHELTGAEMFKLLPEREYSADYTECTVEAKSELQAKSRPALKACPASIEAYDVIYLGYPNWWGTMPMCVYTFLEKFDWRGKVIRPFCTHEGSGMGRSEGDIARACPGAKVERGLAVHGAEASSSRGLVEKWLRR